MEKFWSLVKNKNDIFIFNSLTKKKMLLKSNDIYFDKYKDYKMYKINSNNFKYLLEKSNISFNQFKEKILNSEELNITIVLGLNCNLQCSYCFEKSYDTNETEINDITALIQNIDVYIKENQIKKLNIEFYGGEPFIYYEKMKEIAMEFNKKYKEKFMFNIMTNGTLLTSQRIEKLLDLGLNKIEVSIDGEKSFHDNSRPSKGKRSSYEDIFNNIKTLITYFNCPNELIIVIRVNVSNQSIKVIKGLLDDLEIQEIKNSVYLYFTPVIECGEEVKSSKNNQNIGKMYKLAKEAGFNIPLKYYSIGPCHYHYKHSFVIGNKGVYKCLTNPNSFIGTNLSPNYDYSQYNPPLKCEECTYLPLCFGGCEYQNMDLEENCPIDIFEELLPYILVEG